MLKPVQVYKPNHYRTYIMVYTYDEYRELAKQNKLVIVCGGTMNYFRKLVALLYRCGYDWFQINALKTDTGYVILANNEYDAARMNGIITAAQKLNRKFQR